MFKILPLLVLSAFVLSCVSAQTKQKLKKCPRSCRCFKATGKKGLDVDCGNKQLTDLPTLPKNTVTL